MYLDMLDIIIRQNNKLALISVSQQCKYYV